MSKRLYREDFRKHQQFFGQFSDFLDINRALNISPRAQDHLRRLRQQVLADLQDGRRRGSDVPLAAEAPPDRDSASSEADDTRKRPSAIC